MFDWSTNKGRLEIAFALHRYPLTDIWLAAHNRRDYDTLIRVQIATAAIRGGQSASLQIARGWTVAYARSR